MLASVGAPVPASPFERTAVDPECVILLGALCAEHDARAAELTLWFAQSAHRSLSITRANRIAQSCGPEVELALRRFGATVQATGLSSLRSWAKAKQSFQPDDAWAIHYQPERLTERIGASFELGEAVLSPAAFRLRMRMAIGVGARADALAMLTVESRFWRGRGDGWLSITELERGTGFQRRFLLDSLLDMATAGLLRHHRDGRSHEFAAHPKIADHAESVPTVWGDWPRSLSLLVGIEHALTSINNDSKITTALSEARKLTESNRLFEQYEPPTDPDQVVAHFEAWCLNATRVLCDVR
jgi:hypothetical protein